MVNLVNWAYNLSLEERWKIQRFLLLLYSIEDINKVKERE